MATTTPKLGLIKPDSSDLADINDLNANMDTIDTHMVTGGMKITVSTGAPSSPSEGDIWIEV